MKIHILLMPCLFFITACSNSASDTSTQDITPDNPPSVNSVELPATK